MSIMSINSDTSIYGNIDNFAIEHKIYRTNDFIYQLDLPRHCDIIELEYLELNFVNNDSNIDMINSIKLTMKINELIILSIPLSFLTSLTKPIKCGNSTYYIDLNFDMFFGKIIKLIKIQYSNINFSIHLDAINLFVINFGLVCNLTFLDNCKRKQLTTQFEEHTIQQIQMFNLNLVTSQNKFKFNVPFNGLIKGFFIEAPLQYLLNVKLLFNTEIRYDYNKFLILQKCQKINENLLYIPFNPSKSFKDKSIESYEGSTNLSNIQLIEMEFEFETDIETKNKFNFIQILCLNSNILRYSNGFLSLKYNI